jgi:hypothetical protein
MPAEQARQLVRHGDDLRRGDVVLIDGEWIEALSVYDHDAHHVEFHADLATHGWEVTYLRKDRAYQVRRP